MGISAQRVRQVFALERNILVLSGTVFFFLAALFSWNQLLPLYLRDLGASDSQVGLSYTLMNLAFTLLQWIGGLLANRYGRKALIVLPTFAFAPLYLLAGAMTHWLSLTIVMLVVNSLSALQSPSFGAVIAESVPDGQQGAAFGFFEFCVGLGVAAGPALGAGLLRITSINTLIYATGAVALICAIIRAVFLREVTAQRTLPKASEPKPVFDARLRWFLVAACAFYTGMAFTAHGPFISLHASDVIHLSDSQINWLFAVGSLISTCLSLVGGRLVDRIGSRLMLVVGSLGHFAALLLWAFIPSLSAGLPVFTLSWALMQTSFIAYSTTLAQSTSPESRTTVMGIFGTTIGVVSTFAPTLGSLLRERLNSVAPFWAALAFGLLTALTMTRANGAVRADGTARADPRLGSRTAGASYASERSSPHVFRDAQVQDHGTQEDH